MKVLFIGGTGVISTACTQLAVTRGIDLYLFNRGQTPADLPEGVTLIQGDMNNREGVAQLLTSHTFDVVVDWIAFDVGAIERDVDLFRARTGQYIFISSASTYQKPLTHYLITESTPLVNPFWEYSRKKIACEEKLLQEYRANGFPVTIVRPSHTYGPTRLPTAVGSGPNVLQRIRSGKKVIVHGDGQSLWVLTHNTDFARGFLGLLGNPKAIGHAFHITSDEVLTWNQIYSIIGKAAGAEPHLIHVPSDFINCFDPVTGSGLLGDKAWSVVFDNTKIKTFVPDYVATVPFSKGVRDAIAWIDDDENRRKIDPEKEAMMDRIIAAYERGLQ